MNDYSLLYKLTEIFSFLLGKYDPHNENPRRWKANFRCALNSLPDVIIVPSLCVRKGKDAYRVFKILPEKIPEKVRESKLPVMFASNPNRSNKQKITRNSRSKGKLEQITLHMSLAIYKLVFHVGVQICIPTR